MRQCVGSTRLGAADQALDRGQHERGGLAGAGLRDAEQVAALEQRSGSPVALDRRGLGIALGVERADEGLGEAEMGEGHGETLHWAMPGRRSSEREAHGGRW